ncbi:MAG TPA: hypothetical protein VGV92_02115, partial [Gammaproteobacteria bacterium]|nr:hypothetical protein [Gammaproteobacteria bacterium]
EMTREFNTVTTEIAHYDTKKPDLLNDPEKLAERARMEGFRLDSSRNLVAVQSERQNREQRHAKKVTEAEKRVHFVELEVETTALSVRDPNPEHKNKAHHAFVFQDNHFHPINDPSKDVRYGSDQHHIIDVKDNVVSYRVPQHEDAVSLTDKQKEVLVDKMLDIALEHSENPREDADKFEFSGTFTQMAQDRLSAAIERRMAEVEAKGPAPAPGLESGPSIHE